MYQYTTLYICNEWKHHTWRKKGLCRFCFIWLTQTYFSVSMYLMLLFDLKQQKWNQHIFPLIKTQWFSGSIGSRRTYWVLQRTKKETSKPVELLNRKRSREWTQGYFAGKGNWGKQLTVWIKNGKEIMEKKNTGAHTSLRSLTHTEFCLLPPQPMCYMSFKYFLCAVTFTDLKMSSLKHRNYYIM